MIPVRQLKSEWHTVKWVEGAAAPLPILKSVIYRGDNGGDR